ncbi:type IV pilus biogenesis/stability protein PilW [Entomomonas sp. E2T0]|uniref:type IV pilus biogenesis/stability protein PilW n=1 Tax=Entomomonas sp. E2T0 TaxID=2930213 RepID=UPI00222822E3|nr:type IV pilus biogenesis/stability protein PilW [Entomomonas sp. E2T0]UYZ82909.1 type IV pilus biogenesis/stability protein PilW [Entomomonas sp. E2T0]
MQIFNRLLKILLLTISCLIIAACVTEFDGKKGTLQTEKGRTEAIQAYIDLAVGYVREGQTEQAKQPLLDALKLDSSSVDANATMAYIFQLEKDPIHAEEYFKKALSSEPDSARVLNNYGVFLFQQNRLPEAKQVFLKASQDNFYSGRSMIFENLGLISVQQQDWKTAEDYFQRALRLNRDRVVSILSLANVYYMQGDYANASRYYNGFVATVEGRQSPQSLLLGIRLSNALNDKVKAANYASQLEQLYPSSAEYREYKAGRK